MFLPKRCCRCNAAASRDCFEASFFFVGAFKEALTFGSAPQSISFISYVVVVRPSQECTPSANLDVVLRILSVWLSLALNFGCVTVHEHTITLHASLRSRIMELKNENKNLIICKLFFLHNFNEYLRKNNAEKSTLKYCVLYVTRARSKWDETKLTKLTTLYGPGQLKLTVPYERLQLLTFVLFCSYIKC